MKAPKPINTPEPKYTAQALKAKIEGKAVFLVTVDSKGVVTRDKEISKPLGYDLDQSALKTLRTWKFRPGTRKGAPVPVRVNVEITFKRF